MENTKKRNIANYNNVHEQLEMVVANIAAVTADEQAYCESLTERFDAEFIDDNAVDPGTHDFLSDSGIIIAAGVATANLTKLETIVNPEFTIDGNVALTSFLMGANNGPGVSYDTTAAQVAIQIVDDTNQITNPFNAGALGIQNPGDLNWILSTDLAAGAIILATEVGAATHVVLAIMQDDGLNINGVPSPGFRVFFGATEYTKFNADGRFLVHRIVDQMLLQSRKTAYRTAGTRQVHANYENIHEQIEMIVPNKAVPTVNEAIMLNALQSDYGSELVADSDIDAGAHDFLSDSAILVDNGCVVGDINEIETIINPVGSQDGHCALDTLLLGNSAGGVGVSWDVLAAQTQISITNITHQITNNFTAGLTTVQASGNINWVRVADLVAGAIVLATVAGDATKAVIVAMPDGAANFAALPSPGLRIFYGCYEYPLLNTNGIDLFNNVIDQLLLQSRKTSYRTLAVARNIRGFQGATVVYPDSATGITLLSNIANWTYGNYAAITGALAANSVVTAINAQSMTDTTDVYQVELSRVSDNSILATFKLTAPLQNANFPLSIPSDQIDAGDGVQARVEKMSDAGTAKSVIISVIMLEV